MIDGGAWPGSVDMFGEASGWGSASVESLQGGDALALAANRLQRKQVVCLTHRFYEAAALGMHVWGLQ